MMAEEDQPRKGRPMDNPKCLCGCRYSNHASSEPRACKTTKLAGWDEAQRRFTRNDRCECHAYRGPEPVRSAAQARDKCPHECLPGSRVCVICKSAVPVTAKK